VSKVGEIKSLTGVRGVAALYVVAYHFCGPGDFTSPLRSFVAHGYLAVDLFFVLSGFVMALNYSNLFKDGFSPSLMWKFIVRRIARIYPLYIACTLCFAFRDLFKHIDGLGRREILKSLLLDLAMVQTWGLGKSLDPASWSISCEWAAYLLFPIVLWLGFYTKDARARIATVVSVVCIAALASIPQDIAQRNVPGALLNFAGYQFAFPVMRCIPEFTIGVVCAKMYMSRRSDRFFGHRYVSELIVATVLLLLLVKWTDVLIVGLFPLLVLALASERSLSGRLLGSAVFNRLGILSYGVYLIHMFIGDTSQRVDVLEGRLEIRIPFAHLVGLLVGFSITVILAQIAFWLIERPGRRLIRRWSEPPLLHEPT